jgi:hypothetical protein
VDARVPAAVPAAGRSAPIGGRASALLAHDERLYVTDDNLGLYITEWQGDQFVRHGGVPLGGEAGRMTWHAGYLYACAGQAGVKIIDVADPAAPVVTATVPGTMGAVDVAVADSVVLTVRGGVSRPTMVDLRNPAAPPRQIVVPTGVTRAVDVGQYGYFVQVQGTLIVTSTDPNVSQPVFWSQPTNGFSTDVHVVGGGSRLFIANGQGKTDPGTGINFGAGVEVYDLSVPTRPEFLALIETSIPAQRIAFAGDIMVVLGNEDGLEVIDVGDVFDPRVVGSLWQPFPLVDAASVSGAIVAAALDDGLLALPPVCE